MPISPSEGVAAAIRAAIDSGAMHPGQQLPGERELARQHRVSSTTIARAVAQLERDGYLETRRGRGRFIRPRAAPHRLRGLEQNPVDRRDVTASTEHAAARLAGLLGVPEGTAVHVSRWTETIEGRPVALAVRYRVDPDQPNDLMGAAVELVAATLPTPEQAAQLHITDITPVLLVTRTVPEPGAGSAVVTDRVLAADRVELSYRADSAPR